jgi:hypothetical protein
VSLLRRGDLVKVRSREEILATLDAAGEVDSLPFMPEMLQFSGETLPVFSIAHKTCDTVEHPGNCRSLEHTVHLVGARCDGSAHGGCQAGCMLFFRQEWLSTPDGKPLRERKGEGATVETLAQSTLDGELYRCQATAMKKAAKPLPTRQIGQYWQDLRSGNVPFLRWVRGMAITAFNLYQWQAPRLLRPFGGRQWPLFHGRGDGKRVASGALRPGDLVQVRSKAEIEATLNPDGRNGGMLFDGEMLPFCGTRARVARKIEQIIDEPTGKMIKLRDCLVLEDVVCQGLYHRMCPRGGLPYWREAWLRKVDE